MKSIKIKKIKENYYSADPSWKCGSPICGYGRTPIQAVMNLFAWSEDIDFEIVDETGEDSKTKYIDVDQLQAELIYCPKCGKEPIVRSVENDRWISCKCLRATDAFKFDEDYPSYALRQAVKQWNGEGYVATYRD